MHNNLNLDSDPFPTLLMFYSLLKSSSISLVGSFMSGTFMMSMAITSVFVNQVKPNWKIIHKFIIISVEWSNYYLLLILFHIVWLSYCWIYWRDCNVYFLGSLKCVPKPHLPSNMLWDFMWIRIWNGIYAIDCFLRASFQKTTCSGARYYGCWRQCW